MNKDTLLLLMLILLLLAGMLITLLARGDRSQHGYGLYQPIPAAQERTAV